MADFNKPLYKGIYSAVDIRDNFNYIVDNAQILEQFIGYQYVATINLTGTPGFSALGMSSSIGEYLFCFENAIHNVNANLFLLFSTTNGVSWVTTNAYSYISLGAYASGSSVATEYKYGGHELAYSVPASIAGVATSKIGFSGDIHFRNMYSTTNCATFNSKFVYENSAAKGDIQVNRCYGSLANHNSGVLQANAVYIGLSGASPTFIGGRVYVYQKINKGLA